MEETIAHIELVCRPEVYIARVKTEMGGSREYRSRRFDGLLNQLIPELQAEFEPDM